MLADVGQERKSDLLVTSGLAFEFVQVKTTAVRSGIGNFSTRLPSSSSVCALIGSRERVAVWAQNDEILRRVIAPVAVDVLDLERQASGVGVFLAPAAALAASTRSREQMSS